MFDACIVCSGKSGLHAPGLNYRILQEGPGYAPACMPRLHTPQNSTFHGSSAPRNHSIGLHLMLLDLNGLPYDFSIGMTTLNSCRCRFACHHPIRTNWTLQVVHKGSTNIWTAKEQHTSDRAFIHSLNYDILIALPQFQAVSRYSRHVNVSPSYLASLAMSFDASTGQSL